MSRNWGRVCDKGENSLAILTRERARLDGFFILPSCAFLGVIDRDEKPGFTVGFLSVESLRVYIREMEPRNVSLLCGADENGAELYKAITENADAGGVFH